MEERNERDNPPGVILVNVCYAFFFLDSGYPHDGRTDKNPYPHDRRADNVFYCYSC